MRRPISKARIRPISPPARPAWLRGASLPALVVGGLLAQGVLPEPALGGPGPSTRRVMNAHVPILSFGSVEG